MAGRRAVLTALEQQERAASRAYVEAIASKKIHVGELEEAIERGDAQRIEELLSLNEDDFQDLTETLRNAAIQGGDLEIKNRFERGLNPNTPAFTERLQQQTSKLVTRIGTEQREAIREIMAVNAQLGMGPRTTALDLVGRVTSSGGREGGVIGLNWPQAEAVANARSNLMSGDPDLMRKYLQNSRRDKRYDSMVERAIAEGRPLSKEELDKVVTRYQARLLQTRGETIARTETIEALSYGRDAKMREVAEEIGGELWKEWVASSDSRDSHAAAHGQKVRVDESFIINGYALDYPGDTSHGAPAGETINCRCSVVYEVREKEEAA